MNYRDKLINKFFTKCIYNIKTGFAQEDIIGSFYEDKMNVKYKYEKKFLNEEMFLIKGSKSGIGIYINKSSLFEEFQRLCDSEFYQDLSKVTNMKKEKKTVFSEELCDILTVSVLKIVNQKNNPRNFNLRVFECI